MWPKSQFPPDSVTFTEEILNGKLHFLCSAGDDKIAKLIIRNDINPFLIIIATTIMMIIWSVTNSIVMFLFLNADLLIHKVRQKTVEITGGRHWYLFHYCNFNVMKTWHSGFFHSSSFLVEMSEFWGRRKEMSSVLNCKKIKFSIKDFFSECDRIRRKLRIWLNLLKKPLMENLIFCAVLLEMPQSMLTQTLLFWWF